jgi:hypothetical protein
MSRRDSPPSVSGMKMVAHASGSFTHGVHLPPAETKCRLRRTSLMDQLPISARVWNVRLRRRVESRDMSNMHYNIPDWVDGTIGVTRWDEPPGIRVHGGRNSGRQLSRGESPFCKRWGEGSDWVATSMHDDGWIWHDWPDRSECWTFALFCFPVPRRRPRASTTHQVFRSIFSTRILWHARSDSPSSV